MAEIKKTDFSRFLQNQDFTLHELLIAEIEKLTDPKITDLRTIYKAKQALFDEVLKVGGKSPYSQKLVDQDLLRDNAYTGLAAQNRAMLGHFDPVKAEIAYEVDLILKKYGNSTRLPYLQEDAVIKNLLQDLENFDKKEAGDRPEIESLEEVTNRLEKINLREWVDQLRLRNEAFMMLYAQRNETDASIVTGATKKARNETDSAYYDVAWRINSLADVNGEADYIAVINNINQLLDKELTVAATHRTTAAKRNAKKKEEGKEEDDRPVIK